jgi:hypothetical protein
VGCAAVRNGDQREGYCTRSWGAATHNSHSHKQVKGLSVSWAFSLETQQKRLKRVKDGDPKGKFQVGEGRFGLSRKKEIKGVVL